MSRLEQRWNNFWFAEESLVRLGVFRVLVLVVTAYSMRYPTFYIMKYAGYSADEIPGIWNPLYFLQALGAGPLEAETAKRLLILVAIAIGLALVGLFTRTALLVAAIGCIFWWGLGYSFDQAHHEKISLAFVMMALPFSPSGARMSLDAWIRRLKGRPLAETSPLAAWPIRLTQVSVAITYFFAGASKLAISGVDWLNGYSLQSVVIYESPLTRAIEGSVLFAQLLSIGLLVLQLTFPLVFLDRRLRWIYVPGTIAFHLGAWATMVNGPYYTLWLITTIAFFRVDRIPATIADAWRAGRRFLAVTQTTATLAFVLICVLILNERYPWWVPLALVVLLAVMTMALLRLDAEARNERSPRGPVRQSV